MKIDFDCPKWLSILRIRPGNLGGLDINYLIISFGAIFLYISDVYKCHLLFLEMDVTSVLFK